MKYQQLTRLFVTSSLENKIITLLSAAEIHYLANVMRKKLKEQLLLFNSQDGEYLAEIIEINNKKIILNLLEKIREPKKEKEVNLIFAPIKQTKILFLLEKATELGVTILTPVKTKHSVVDKINLTKWQIYTKEASEQCGRLSLPEIKPLEKLDKFLNRWDHSKKIILCNEKEKNLHIAQYIRTTEGVINVMVGPEGGFSKEELQLLEGKDFIISVHLGERILRAETASIAALAYNNFISACN